MSTPSTDMWSQWWKLQGRMLDAWKEAVKTADKKEETTTAANDLWQTWIRTQEQMLELWKTTVLPAAGQKSPVYPGPVMDVWQEWGRNQDKMLSLWKQALTMSPPDKVMQSFAGPFKDLWREWWNVQEKILALCKQAATAEPGGLTDLFGIRSARMWPEMLRNQEKMLGFWNEFMGLSQPGKA
ncbi:MAG: hypothetical protein NUV35_08645, partial [Syntrophomonadaceae bacterium]|nr:hypothetical protein [Syntrophomonadaceae bacterium]